MKTIFFSIFAATLALFAFNFIIITTKELYDH